MLTRQLRFGRTGQDPPDRLILGDNAAVLADIPPSSIDLIYIDPPFGTGTVRRGGQLQPKSQYRDAPNDPDVFVEWLGPCLVACRQVLAAHGSLFVHLDYRSVHYVKVELDRIFGRQRFVNEIIWCYAVGGKSKRRFGRKHDTILWYARSAEYAFYPDAIKVPRRAGSHMRVVETEDGELVQEKTDRKSGKVYRYPLAAGKVPEDWWTDVEILNRSDTERTGWPTQKPERLVERIVKATSADNAQIADWFCGSATTAAVAQRLGRRFIAVDAESMAIECAVARLETAGAALAQKGHPPRDIAIETWSTPAAVVESERDTRSRRRGRHPALTTMKAK